MKISIISLVGGLIVLFAANAFSQISYPLPGRTVIKLLPDSLRPQIYALNQANGSVPGTLLELNATNGAIIHEITVNTNPTDMTMTSSGDTIFVINAGSRTISKVDLNSFMVVAEKSISTPNTYSASNPLHLTSGGTNLVYFTDGAWAPNIYAFDFNGGTNVFGYSGAAYLDYNNVATPNGAGGLAATRDGKTLYTWMQYGWGAGYARSVITRLMTGQNTLTLGEYSPLQYRDPLDTPILLDASEKWVFNKVQMVSATNVSVLLNQFTDNIYSIAMDGSIAFGPTEIFDARTGGAILNLPFSATVQTVSGDQKRLFRYNASTANLVIYDLNSLISPVITQSPTNQTIYSGNSAVISVSAAGLSPMTFLWYFNGTNFAATANGQMVISNIQATNTGSYGVVVTNVFGAAVSSNAILTVVNGAPNIITQPTSKIAIAGASAAFSVNVAGSLPLNYQWQSGGTNLNGATNATLALTNLQLANQGNYASAISNAFGSTNSANAYLTVVDAAGALNTTNLVWTAGGDVPWFVQTDTIDNYLGFSGFPYTHDGFASMQSGNTTFGQQSILQTTIHGPATLTYWWQSASFGPYMNNLNYLSCSCNGVQQASISASTPWQPQTVYLGAGTNLLQWDYSTGVDTGNRAAAWLDQVNVAPGGTLPYITIPPSAQMVSIGSNAVINVTAAGTPPFTYQWRLNGTNINGATSAALTLSNLSLADAGYYDAVVGNAFGSTNSSSAYLNVVDTSKALNTTNLIWTADGDAPWFVQTSVTYDGFAAMQSGSITANQQSTIQTTVTGPGTLTFWWNVSSEAVNDFLAFSVNGVEQGRISGIVILGFYGWQQQTIYVGAGAQKLQWTYIKTDSGVSNSGRDSGWLDQVSFTPGGTSPFITLNPTNQVVLVGSNATLNAAALGTPPLSYKWQLNQTNLDGATNALLALTNVQITNEGNYTLMVSNAFGVTNITAYVNVVDFTESLNATNPVWSSSGDQPWFPETSISHDGIAALQSGAITGGQQSTVQTTVNGPGTLSFWWMVSSETNNDFANFTVDGLEQFRISGAVNWQQLAYSVASGTHTLAWNYSKNATINIGSDAAWLDQVSYVSGATAPVITANPTNQIAQMGQTASFQVAALGTPPLYYQWLFNGTNIAGATNSTLTIANVQIANSGNYQVVVANNYGSTNSATAILLLQNVVAWGAGTSNTFTSPIYGQSVVPGNLAGVSAIAAGGYHSMALLPNGQVTAWGYNNYGETNTPTTLTNATAIAAGLYHSLALRSNGTATAWGQNFYNQTTVPASATNVSAIAAGWYHNLALRNNGTVVAWGAGTFQSSSPYFGQSMVPTNLTGVAAVAAGGYHSLVLLTNGTVVAWGWNAFGQTNVPIGLSNVVAIAAGGSNSIALKNDGTLVAWGANGYGQTNIPAGLSNVVAISSGAGHNMALKNDGTLVVWGLNGNGQTNVSAGLTNVAGVAAGGYHSLALMNVGPVTFLNPPYSQTIFKGGNATFMPAFLGAAPLNCQWQHNGTNLDSGTNASLTISNALLADAGNYQLIVSNSFGAATSATAFLSVNDTAPFFTGQPTNLAVMLNANATLIADAGGLPPFTYQWLFNGAVIAGATNATVTVTNAQLVNEGLYALLATNAYGQATSSNAYLDVVDVPEALGPTNWLWQILYQQSWAAESTNTHDGFAAAASGPIPYGLKTVLQSYVAGPGKLSFWWSGQQNVTMSFQIDGVTQTSQQFFTGSGWSQFTYYLAPTVHTLTWTASNQSFSSATNMGFLDQVVFTPGITPASLTSQPASQNIAAGNNVTFSVGTTGTPPMTYQWYFNGSLIPGATSSSLALNNIQAGNAGSYNVVVGNSAGAAASSNALLTVTPSAPVITSQPASAPVILGGSITISGGASGTSPIYYQWLFNNLPIPGATNSSLTLNNVQYADAGNYSLLASNQVGAAVSSAAGLFVYSTGDLGATLDTPGINWSTANVPWFPQTNTTHDGVSAAQSGGISGSQQSTLQTVVTGPAMVVYWWKVNCDSFWDALAFSANGTIQSSITGTVDWQQVTNFIGSGSQTLQWNLYPVHGAFAGGTGWVDQVQVIPIPGTPAVITTNPASSSTSAGNNVTLSVSVTGTPTLLYQWQFNGSNLPGATNATLTLNNVQAGNAGTYAVTVTNDYGYAVSSDATLTVNPSGPVITGQAANQTNVINSSTSLAVAVKGTPPFNYQWYFNNSAIVGATSNILVISSPQMTNAGNYYVVISNLYGQATSVTIRLSLVPSKVIDYWPYNNAGYSAPSNVGNVSAIAAGSFHTMALRTDGTVLVWGTNVYSQTNVPPDLTNVVAIAAGNNHCLALKADGTLTAWGDNGFGEGSIPAGLSNVIAIASGPTYNLALKNDGTVAGWGNDNYGQTDIPAGLTNVRAIYAGYYNGFATMSDGSLVQWGTGPVWQHNGTNTQLNFPNSNVVSIAAGSFTGWSLQNDGVARAYGFIDGSAPYTNTYQGLTAWSTATRSPNFYPGTIAIAASGTSSPLNDYVLLLGGGGFVTEVNVSGQPPGLGNSSIPYISNSPGNITAIAANNQHAVALISDGSPHFNWPPLSRAVFSGDTVAFNISATGISPLNYQWQFNGTNLDSATNSLLVMTNVSQSAAGQYGCVVSNAYGTASSLNATLTVLRSQLRFNDVVTYLNGTFGLQLDQLSGHGDIIILTSTNLVDWVPIFTNPPVMGSLQFHDPGSKSQPARFYRAIEW